MSLQCAIPNDKIYKIAKGRFDRETAQQQQGTPPTTTAHDNQQQKGATGGQPQTKRAPSSDGFPNRTHPPPGPSSTYGNAYTPPTRRTPSPQQDPFNHPRTRKVKTRAERRGYDNHPPQPIIHVIPPAVSLNHPPPYRRKTG